MPCYRPLKGYRSIVRNPSGKRSIVFNKKEGFADLPIDVPCGQCTGCRLDHSRVWAARCMHEAKMHKHNCFLTLTYNDKNLPKIDGIPTLDKTDLQKFLKRLRSHIEYNWRKKTGYEGSIKHKCLNYPHIKYYACGEYGTKNHRPHYHICLFGYQFSKLKKWKYIPKTKSTLFRSEELESLWTHGFSSIGELNFETAAYTARYCMKKAKGKNKESHYEVFTKLDTGEVISKEPEFALMSRNPGIGKKYLQHYKNDIYPRDFIYVRGQKTKVPKYYDNVMLKEDPKLMEKVKGKRRHEAKQNHEENSLARLKTKEYCKQQSITNLQRSIE
jgi:hypothetical protein